MVVADEHALACIFTANDVTRDGVRHDSRIRERKIFRDHAAPAVGPKFDSSHGWPGKYTRSDISAEHPDWPAVGGRPLRLRLLQKFLYFFFFQPFHDCSNVLRTISGADYEGISGLD